MKKIALGFMLAGLSVSVCAQEEVKKTISSFGMQSEGGYFRVVEPLVLQCPHNAIYFKASNMTSVLLAAKMAGKTLSRINYSIDAAGLCSLVLVEVE